MVSGLLDVVLVIYDKWPAEAVQTSSYTVQAGDLDIVLIVYTNWPAESTQTTYSLQGGTLV
jgi:hypothetical protein